MAVAGVLPRVRRNLERLPDAAGGQHNRFRAKHDEPAALAVVGQLPGDAVTVLKGE